MSKTIQKWQKYRFLTKKFNRNRHFFVILWGVTIQLLAEKWTVSPKNAIFGQKSCFLAFPPAVRQKVQILIQSILTYLDRFLVSKIVLNDTKHDMVAISGLGDIWYTTLVYHYTKVVQQISPKLIMATISSLVSKLTNFDTRNRSRQVRML